MRVPSPFAVQNMNVFRIRHIVFSGLFAALMATYTQAAIITGVSISSVSAQDVGTGDGRLAVNVVNGYGLDPGPTDVTLAKHNGVPGTAVEGTTNGMWLTGGGQTS